MSIDCELNLENTSYDTVATCLVDLITITAVLMRFNMSTIYKHPLNVWGFDQ